MNFTAPVAGFVHSKIVLLMALYLLTSASKGFSLSLGLGVQAKVAKAAFVVVVFVVRDDCVAHSYSIPAPDLSSF